MFSFWKSEKPPVISDADKTWLQRELDEWIKIKSEINLKWKEIDSEFYITVNIDKRILTIEAEETRSKTPNVVTFLIKLDCDYPRKPPHIFSKSNFTIPTLMDGRDLMSSVFPDWTPQTKIADVIKVLPSFLAKAINLKAYKFYGGFQLGAVYDWHTFDTMWINTFSCRVEPKAASDKKSVLPSLNLGADYCLIWTGDALVWFDKMETGNGKIVFWATLFSIADIKINKKEKIVSMNFYDDDMNTEFYLKLSIENIWFFRDTLVKKMNRLEIKSESLKWIRGQKLEKRLTSMTIKNMSRDEIETNVFELKRRIEEGEINDYTVETFAALCGKLIEFSSEHGDDNHMKYLEIMKGVLNWEEVQKLTIEHQKEMERNSKMD